MKILILSSHSFAKNDWKNLSEDLCTFRFFRRFRRSSLMGTRSSFLASACVSVCMFRRFASPSLSVSPFSDRKKCGLCHDLRGCCSLHFVQKPETSRIFAYFELSQVIYLLPNSPSLWKQIFAIIVTYRVSSEYRGYLFWHWLFPRF